MALFLHDAQKSSQSGVKKRLFSDDLFCNVDEMDADYLEEFVKYEAPGSSDLDDIEKLKSLLHDFNLLQLLPTLQAANVTYRCLQYLHKKDLVGAIPHVGLRVEFKEKLFMWRKNEIGIEDETISNPNKVGDWLSRNYANIPSSCSFNSSMKRILNKMTMSTNTNPTLKPEKTPMDKNTKKRATNEDPLDGPSTSKRAKQNLGTIPKNSGFIPRTLADIESLEAIDDPYGIPEICAPPILPVVGGFQNLTKCHVSRDVEAILSFGPKFMPPTKPNIGHFVDQLYLLHNTAFKKQVNVPHDYLLEGYDGMISSLVGSTNVTEKLLLTMVTKTKRFLADHPEFCLVQSDKTRSTVLISRSDYHLKMSSWLSNAIDRGDYQHLDDIVTVKHKRAIWLLNFKRLLRRLDAQWVATQSNRRPYHNRLHMQLHEYNKPTLSVPSVYGVLKMHKADVPCRPICNTRGWFSRPLQGIICDCLTSVLRKFLDPDNVWNVSNAAHIIRSTISMPKYRLLKLDIVEMYPSMDRVGIHNSVSRFVTSNLFSSNSSMDPQLLLDILTLCLNNNTIFIYGESYYLQVCGLPQGARDSGVLATIYIDHILTAYHHDIMSSNLVVWKLKYVDDFLFYMHEDHVDSLLQQLESRLGLKFMIEEDLSPTILESTVVCGEKVLSIMPYLDLMIHHCERHMYVRTYTKSMSSLRVCHYLSACKATWKRNTIDGYIRRVLLRTSNCFLLSDLGLLLVRFHANMYPTVTVHGLISVAIANHIKLCKSAINRCDQYPQLISLGNLHTRTDLLEGFLAGFPSAPTQHDPLASIVIKHRVDRRNCLDKTHVTSSPFTCETFSHVLDSLFSKLDIGQTSNRMGTTLYTMLDMDNNSRDLISSSPRLPNIFLVSCPACPMAFIFCGHGSVHDMIQDSSQDTSSDLYQHMRHTSHPVPHRHIPLQFQLSSQESIPLDHHAALIKIVAEHLGHECLTNMRLGSIPSIVKHGLIRALRALYPS